MANERGVATFDIVKAAPPVEDLNAEGIIDIVKAFASAIFRENSLDPTKNTRLLSMPTAHGTSRSVQVVCARPDDHAGDPLEQDQAHSVEGPYRGARTGARGSQGDGQGLRPQARENDEGSRHARAHQGAVSPPRGWAQMRTSCCSTARRRTARRRRHAERRARLPLSHTWSIAPRISPSASCASGLSCASCASQCSLSPPCGASSG